MVKNSDNNMAGAEIASAMQHGRGRMQQRGKGV